MASKRPIRVAIIGAGPIGLEAALRLRQWGAQVRVFEKGRIAEHVRQWGHVTMFSPFGMNSTSAGILAIREENCHHSFPEPQQCITGHEYVSCYLEPLARTHWLRDCIQTNTQVLRVGRSQFLKEDLPGGRQRGSACFRLLVRQGDQEIIEEADVVLDCSGTYAQHRWLGEGGIPALGEMGAQGQIRYTLEDITGTRAEHYRGRTVMVVGSGYSAATAVCALAQLAEQEPATWTVWLTRRDGPPIRRFPHDPLVERDRLAQQANRLAARGEGNVEHVPQAHVQSVEFLGPDKGFRVRARVQGKTRTWEVERLVAHVGYSPDYELYRELQIHECYATLGPMRLSAALLQMGGDCLQAPTVGVDTLRNPEPNFFILGAKSYGRNSAFLLQTGFAQIEMVLSLLQQEGLVGQR
ncbi:MAG: NAD(P)-binding domain-containing protein [Gemmatales bacterium]|nr:NAD(P)-binding domain-containing protein [Gemmatales bacterium]MDW7995481.1 NAD(P)-binding domain-containing protein [Gemmatales bacterium]